ncbi:MAG: MFS transporter [Rhodospirillaceae bacterium]|nr:MFS transporter [Rhodospirillaceae bacterium]MBT5898633.1 MFS transporter [Rhodospirillaceae bacterium]MBT6431296.1 MFS transporter [Rhodospirillaceae bacterium]
MPLLLLAVVAMLVQQTMATVAKTAIPVLFPAIALELGAASQAVLAYTWVFAVIGVLVMAGCGTFIIRYGAIRMSQVGGLLMAGGLVLAALAGIDYWTGIVMLTLGAVLISAGSTSATPASSEILARYAPPRIAPFIFSIKQTGVPAGIAIAGALVLPLSVWIGWQSALLVTAGICLVIAAGLQPCRREFDRDRNPEQKLAFGDVKETVRAVLQQPALRAMAMAAFVFVGLQAIFTNFTVVYLYEELHYTAVEAGAILGLTTLVAVPARIFWGLVASTIMPARPLLGLLAAVMAVAAAAMGAFSPEWSQWQVSAVCVVIAMTALSWHGVLLSEVARIAPDGAVGRLTGGVLAFGTAGQVASPILFGALYFPFGYQAAYLAVALPAAVVAVIMLRRRPAATASRLSP